MTPEIAKRWLPIIQAVAEGKMLQIRVTVHDIPGAYDWQDLVGDGVLTPPLSHDPMFYRIKPEPREFWIARGGGIWVGVYGSKAGAEAALGSNKDRFGNPTNIIHVREVIDG